MFQTTSFLNVGSRHMSFATMQDGDFCLPISNNFAADCALLGTPLIVEGIVTVQVATKGGTVDYQFHTGENISPMLKSLVCSGANFDLAYYDGDDWREELRRMREIVWANGVITVEEVIDCAVAAIRDEYVYEHIDHCEREGIKYDPADFYCDFDIDFASYGWEEAYEREAEAEYDRWVAQAEQEEEDFDEDKYGHGMLCGCKVCHERALEALDDYVGPTVEEIAQQPVISESEFMTRWKAVVGKNEVPEPCKDCPHCRAYSCRAPHGSCYLHKR